jgi:hypothetical protein
MIEIKKDTLARRASKIKFELEQKIFLKNKVVSNMLLRKKLLV